MSLTIFANILIDDEKRFSRLKQSFFSFYKSDIDYWIINLRGFYKEEVSKFLLSHLNKENLEISFIDSKKGWFFVSRKIIKNIKTSYVFIWNEDHINQSGFKTFNKIVEDIKKKE